MRSGVHWKVLLAVLSLERQYSVMSQCNLGFASIFPDCNIGCPVCILGWWLRLYSLDEIESTPGFRRSCSLRRRGCFGFVGCGLILLVDARGVVQWGRGQVGR